MNDTATLTPGQTVAADMTGLGHNVIATYIGPITPSKKYPEGGHFIRLLTGGKIAVRRAPQPSNGKLIVAPPA